MDYEAIDKYMSRRCEEVFSDPKRHAFSSEFAEDEAMDTRGPRGGKIRGRKTRCVHCGQKPAVHATTTEPL